MAAMLSAATTAAPKTTMPFMLFELAAAVGTTRGRLVVVGEMVVVGRMVLPGVVTVRDRETEDEVEARLVLVDALLVVVLEALELDDVEAREVLVLARDVLELALLVLLEAGRDVDVLARLVEPTVTVTVTTEHALVGRSDDVVARLELVLARLELVLARLEDVVARLVDELAARLDEEEARLLDEVVARLDEEEARLVDEVAARLDEEDEEARLDDVAGRLVLVVARLEEVVARLVDEEGRVVDVVARLEEVVARLVLDDRLDVEEVGGRTDVVGRLGTPAHPVLEQESPGLQYQLVQHTKPTGMQPAPQRTEPDLHSPGPGHAWPSGQQRLSLVQYSPASQKALLP